MQENPNLILYRDLLKQVWIRWSDSQIKPPDEQWGTLLGSV